MKNDSRLPSSASLKLDLMFDGVRYSSALGEAAAHAFPNFYPYRFRPGEPNPTGKPKVTAIRRIRRLCDVAMNR